MAKGKSVNRTNVLDWELLALRIRNKIKELGITQNQMSAESGINPATLSRFLTRPTTNVMDIENVRRACNWVGWSLEIFAKERPVAKGSGNTLQDIKNLIHNDKTLTRAKARDLTILFEISYRALAKRGRRFSKA